MRLRRPAVCVVTRARGTAGSPERGALVTRLAAAAASGATMIQIRERQLDDRELLRFASEVVDAVRPFGTLVLLNDRTDIALTARADGVHLRSGAPSARDIRRIVPETFTVGRSVHSTAEAIEAESSGGCDYLFFGTVFRSASKPEDHQVAGIERLVEVCHAVRLPVLAIGGISIDNAAEVVAAGAFGVAAISLFSSAPDIGATVRDLAGALTPSRAAD